MKLRNMPRKEFARKVCTASLLVAGAMGCASAQQKSEAPSQTSAQSSKAKKPIDMREWEVRYERHELKQEAGSYSYEPGPMHADNPNVDASIGSGKCSTHTNIERRKVKVGDWVQGLGTLLRHDEKWVVFECFPAVEGGYGSVDLRDFDGPNIQATFEKGETPNYMYVTVTVGK